MKVLGVVPARGGSKGVPGKNIRLLCGKPDCGLMPRLLPIATPLRIPVILEVPPR